MMEGPVRMYRSFLKLPMSLPISEYAGQLQMDIKQFQGRVIFFIILPKVYIH